MVDRFTSDALELPSSEHAFERADLIFYGIDHSGSSYEAQVFLDQRGVHGDPGAEHRAYVGSFFILGHGGCFGDAGHCDVPRERDPFDLRPPHQLAPAVRVMTVTEPVRALLDRGGVEAKVTVIVRTAPRTPADVLAFDRIRLATYA